MLHWLLGRRHFNEEQWLANVIKGSTAATPLIFNKIIPAAAPTKLCTRDRRKRDPLKEKKQRTPPNKCLWAKGIFRHVHFVLPSAGRKYINKSVYRTHKYHPNQLFLLFLQQSLSSFAARPANHCDERAKILICPSDILKKINSFFSKAASINFILVREVFSVAHKCS